MQGLQLWKQLPRLWLVASRQTDTHYVRCNMARWLCQPVVAKQLQPRVVGPSSVSLGPEGSAGLALAGRALWSLLGGSGVGLVGPTGSAACVCRGKEHHQVAPELCSMRS